MRKAKPQAADGGAAHVPVTRLMVIESAEIEGDPEAWLERMRKDQDERDALIDRGAHALQARAWPPGASPPPTPPSPTRLGSESALAIRIGFGQGDELVERQWEQAIEVPHDQRRASRSEALRPQERMAALLGPSRHPARVRRAHPARPG